MNIKLYIGENSDIKLSLFGGKRERDSMEWKDENSLSQLLLASLDKLLRKNGVGLDKISEYTIMSKVPRKWTTYRIADITFRTLKLAGVAKK
jgi:hypothetical protein